MPGLAANTVGGSWVLCERGVAPLSCPSRRGLVTGTDACRGFAEAKGWEAESTARNTCHMVDDNARELAIYHALKAVDEVAPSLPSHLIEEHKADLERPAAQSTFTNSLKLLRQARERVGEGLRAVQADTIAVLDDISLRNEQRMIPLHDERPHAGD
jgi:hypothetical protein